MPRGPAKSFDPDAALDAAIECFGTKGYAAAGLAELLSAMGIARKSLYDTFGDKRGLFTRAVERYSARQLETLRAELAHGPSRIAAVGRMLRRRQRECAAHGNWGCLFAVGAAQTCQDDPQFAALFRLHLRRVEDLLHDALRAARDAGELTPHGSPRSHARMVLATLQGLAVTGRVMDSPSFSRGVIEATLAALRP